MDDDEPLWTKPRGQLYALAEEFVRTDQQLRIIAKTKQELANKAGFVAEIAHKATFNFAAINESHPARAYSDRDSQFTLNGCTRNGHSDIIIVNSNEAIPPEVQVKYHGIPKQTAKSLRQPGPDGYPKYENQQLVVPSDQLPVVHAEARRDRLKETGPNGRAAVAYGAAMVEVNARDRIVCGPVESRPLALNEARAIARDPTGLEKLSIFQPYLEMAIEAVAFDDRVAERPFNPNTLLTGDPIDRLINNGTLDDILSAIDDDGTVSLEYIWESTDPDVPVDELDDHDKVRTFIRGLARESTD